MIDEQIRYPIGKFKSPETVNATNILNWMDTIEKFPERLTKEVTALNDSQLDTPYREEGWTVRQVVHHVADSHMNAYIRFKLTLTEDTPTIKPYLEARWAELPDSKAPITLSLPIVEGVHKRWIIILKSMKSDDFEKKMFHPEHHKELILKNVLALYAWHCNHHLAHITSLKEKKNW